MAKIHLHIARRLKRFKWHFLFQMLCAVLFVYLILLAFGLFDRDRVLSGIGISSLCASIFIVFAMPDTKVARPSRILGGYAIAMLSGIFCHLLLPEITHEFLHSTPLDIHLIVGAIAVTAAMLLMAIFDLQHPPASGLTLGLTIVKWDTGVFLIVSASILLLCAIRVFLKKYLVSLL